jgi:hypothetical protein
LSILLPKYLAAFKHAETIEVCRQIQDAEGDIVCLDARRLVFVDPFALTLLGASLYELKQWGQRVRVSGLRPDIGGYLQRMDLFEDVEFVDCAPSIGQRHDRRDSLVELTRVDDDVEAADAARRIAQALVGCTGVSDAPEGDQAMEAVSPADRLLQLVQYVLSELIENAVTHGQKQGFRGKCRTWVASQYYPRKDTVRLSVTDTGCGFLATLRGHPDLGAETHFSAILTAMKPRVSCNRDLGIRGETVNQGVGLTTVARIAGLAEGKTLIVSGNAYHSTSGSRGRLPEGAFWQGVAVAIEMQRAQLQAIRIADALPQILTSRTVSPRFE